MEAEDTSIYRSFLLSLLTFYYFNVWHCNAPAAYVCSRRTINNLMMMMTMISGVILLYSVNVVLSGMLGLTIYYWLGRFFDRVDLIKPVSNVHSSVHTSTKSFFDFNRFWHVGRGWWIMHDGMQYYPIQGQDHEPIKRGNLAIFKSYLLRRLQWELATDLGFLN